MTGGQVQFYAATAGHEAATLVALSLSGETLAQNQSDSAVMAVNNVAALVPLNDSALALVGSLLTLTISTTSELSLESAEAEAAVSVAFLPATTASVGQSLSRYGVRDAAESAGETADDAAEVANPPAPAASAWERFILGLDQALDQFRREHRDWTPGSEDKNAGARERDSAPRADSSSAVGPTSWKSTLEPSPGAIDPERQDGEQRTGMAEALDAIIESLWVEGAPRIVPDGRVGSTPIHVVLARPGIEDAHRGRSRFPAIDRRLHGAFRIPSAPRQDEPAELSIPLAAASFLTAWAVIVRPNAAYERRRWDGNRRNRTDWNKNLSADDADEKTKWPNSSDGVST